MYDHDNRQLLCLFLGYSKNDDIASIKWHFLVDSSYICPYCPASQSRFDNFYKLRSHLVTHKTEQVGSVTLSLTLSFYLKDEP